MKMNIVVIGANAAGAKATSKSKRINPKAEVTLIDRGNFISYGACGIPYFVSDAVEDVKELMSTAAGVIRDHNFFKKVKGVTVKINTEVITIDRVAKTVRLRDLQTSMESILRIEMSDQMLPGVLDREMASLVEKQLKQQGVTVMTGSAVSGLVGDAAVRAVQIGDKQIPADLVVLAPGVTPNVELARAAGLEIGSTGVISVDKRQCTSDPDIYACGDCCETTHLITGRKVFIPLGSTANKQGRAVRKFAPAAHEAASPEAPESLRRFHRERAFPAWLTQNAPAYPYLHL